jgi:hypothetical protein
MNSVQWIDARSVEEAVALLSADAGSRASPACSRTLPTPARSIRASAIATPLT